MLTIFCFFLSISCLLLSKGYPDKFIADRLRISTYTVHGHVRNIFEKLRVHNRVEAVVKCFQE